VRRPRRLFTGLLLLVLVTGGALLAWRFLGEEDAAGLGRRKRAPAAGAVAASDARATGVERELEARSAEAGAPPDAVGDVAIEPTPESGVPVVVVARGSGEPQPFALVTRIEFPWDERADASSHRDVGWLLDHLGRRFRADARGFVRIPPSAGRLELFARVGALAGYAPLDACEVKPRDDAPPKRIEVAPLADLRVRVVDPGGSPVPDVPFQVVGDGGGRMLPSIFAQGEATGPDGLAELRGASLLIDDGVPSGGLLVVVNLPLRRPLSLRVARAELDGTPRTLVMPATGSVELVLVDEHGDVPAIDEASGIVLLRGPRRGSMTAEEQRLQIGDVKEVTFRVGRAPVPFVELGDWIEADVDFGVRGRGYVQAAGPTVAGTAVRIDVPIRANANVVAVLGRVVDPEGRPIAERELRGNYSLVSGNINCGGCEVVRTHADGSFELPVRGSDDDSPPPVWNSMKLVLAIVRPGGGFDFQHEFELDGEFARHGDDLGTIVLAPVPLVASGVVVDESGAPVEHVRVGLVQKSEVDPRFQLPSNPPVFNTTWDQYAARSGADGNFAIRGDPGRGVFGLAVNEDRYLPLPPLPIELGATGLRIVVARPAALLAHVLLDPGVPPDFVLGRIRVPRDGDASHDVEQWRAPDERGDLRFELLPPRPAQVVIRAHCFGSPQVEIARFDAIPLTAGERTVDPRLQAIDLRGRFLVTHLVVVDPDGQPVRDVTVRAVLDSSADGSRDESEEQTALELGGGDLVTTGTPPSIEVEAAGFRPQRTPLNPPETRVTLRRGLEVVFELDPSIPELPESCFYVVSLAPGDFLESADDAPTASFAHDSARSLRVERPGDCAVQLWLARYFNRHALGMNELKSGRVRVRVEDSDTVTKLRVTATPADVKATLADLGL
jgi:hypothetical protein